MPARLRACAADARAPQPAVCQAPIGSIGFLPPTARLCLRRPCAARSAERGRYLCSTPSSLTTVSSASFAFPEGGRAIGRVQRRASGVFGPANRASGSLLPVARRSRYRHAPARRLRVGAAGVCAVRGSGGEISCQLSMRMSPSRDRRETKENDQHARRRCSGRICCRHPVCCSWQHCCWAGRMIGDGCLVDNVWNEESSSSKHANVFFCSSPGTSAWKETSWQGRPCTRSLLRRGCPPRSRPRRLRFGA